MSTSIRAAAWLDWPETRKLAQVFAARRAPLRFVGGCVRDALLGREVHEVDAATPLVPEAVMALLEEAGIRAIPTGIAHGTVTALIDKRPFEITTLRRDVACDGRHAEVAFTADWQEDAARRDFTVNALYADADGTVHDYFDGLKDLNPPVLKFIGRAEERIAEDALRILRLFRFMAQLGAAPDAAGLKACAALAKNLETLSGERIAQEMLKLLGAEALSMATLQALADSGAPAHIALPALPSSMARLLEMEKTFALPASPLRRLALWAEATDKLVERWRLSGALREALKAIRELAGAITQSIPEAEQKRLLRHYGKEIFVDAAAVALAAQGDAQAFGGMWKLSNAWEIPVFPLAGRDLLEAGYAEGPKVGAKLKELETWWEAEDYRPDRAALLKRLAQ